MVTVIEMTLRSSLSSRLVNQAVEQDYLLTKERFIILKEYLLNGQFNWGKWHSIGEGSGKSAHGQQSCS